MFCNVRENGEIELIAHGSDEMNLLKRMADGVKVQAYDDSVTFRSIIILAPVLLPSKETSV